MTVNYFSRLYGPGSANSQLNLGIFLAGVPTAQRGMTGETVDMTLGSADD